MESRDEDGTLESWLALVDDLEVTRLPAPFPRFDSFDRLPTL